MRIAAIDIGSNTILMQIASYDKITNKVEIISDLHGIARLSENLNQTGIISDIALRRANNILQNYYENCTEQVVDKIIAVGTSAMREAKNADEIKQKLETVFENNCKIQIITGEQESLFSFKGATNDIGDAHKQCIVLDIGGGSTEIIIGNKKNITHSVSIPIGVVKLTEKFGIKQPINKKSQKVVEDFIKQQLVAANCITNFEKNAELIAVSGTPVALAKINLGLQKYDAEKINNYVFTIDRLNETLNNAFSATLEELICRYGIKEARADVLSAGALILKEVLELFSIEQIKVSTNGLRHGIILSEFGL